MHSGLQKANFFEKLLRYRVARFILRDVPEDKLSIKELKALEAIRLFK